jgi:hypothetical protein
MNTKIQELHEKENELNREIGKIDKEIKLLQKRKVKLAKQVSANMKYRNKLIDPAKYNIEIIEK